MDNSSREHEKEVFEIIWHREGGSPEGGSEEGPITDGSEFPNPTGERMEPEQSIDEAQTSVDCDDQVVTKTGEVY